ncbi:MAG: hypothetical protein LBB88_00910 [Planctomycetaceae bacterium]|nr:hypothetical protein [Planctomycetaceae bacterium]
MRGHWGQRGRWGHWGHSCLKSGIDGSEETKFKEKIFSFLKAIFFC